MKGFDFMLGQCARCGLNNSVRICKNPETGKGPEFCSTLLYKDIIEEAKKRYEEEDMYFASEAARQERSGYVKDDRSGLNRPTKPRIVETIEFCHRMNFKKVGLAFCGALHKEASIISKILTVNGLEVVSAMCKVGGVDKCSFLGLNSEETLRGGTYEPMCNPIAQAMIFNKEHTDFNIIVGLCVGHDSLFIKYSEAMCTVLASKDRLMGHNPLAPIYTSHSYYKFLTADSDDGGKQLEDNSCGDTKN